MEARLLKLVAQPVSWNEFRMLYLSTFPAWAYRGRGGLSLERQILADLCTLWVTDQSTPTLDRKQAHAPPTGSPSPDATPHRSNLHVLYLPYNCTMLCRTFICCFSRSVQWSCLFICVHPDLWCVGLSIDWWPHREPELDCTHLKSLQNIETHLVKRFAESKLQWFWLFSETQGYLCTSRHSKIY